MATRAVGARGAELRAAPNASFQRCEPRRTCCMTTPQACYRAAGCAAGGMRITEAHRCTSADSTDRLQFCSAMWSGSEHVGGGGPGCKRTRLQAPPASSLGTAAGAATLGSGLAAAGSSALALSPPPAPRPRLDPPGALRRGMCALGDHQVSLAPNRGPSVRGHPEHHPRGRTPSCSK